MLTEELRVELGKIDICRVGRRIKLFMLVVPFIVDETSGSESVCIKRNVEK